MSCSDLLIARIVLLPLRSRAFCLSLPALVGLCENDSVVLDDIDDDVVHIVAIESALSITLTGPDTLEIDTDLLASDRWVRTQTGAVLACDKFLGTNRLFKVEITSRLART